MMISIIISFLLPFLANCYRFEITYSDLDIIAKKHCDPKDYAKGIFGVGWDVVESKFIDALIECYEEMTGTVSPEPCEEKSECKKMVMYYMKDYRTMRENRDFSQKKVVEEVQTGVTGRNLKQFSPEDVDDIWDLLSELARARIISEFRKTQTRISLTSMVTTKRQAEIDGNVWGRFPSNRAADKNGVYSVLNTVASLLDGLYSLFDVRASLDATLETRLNKLRNWASTAQDEMELWRFGRVGQDKAFTKRAYCKVRDGLYRIDETSPFWDALVR